MGNILHVENPVKSTFFDFTGFKFHDMNKLFTKLSYFFT